MIKVSAQHPLELLIAAALHNPVMEIEVAFALVIALTLVLLDLHLMLGQQGTELSDLLLGHVSRGQAAGHSFQGLADKVKLHQFFQRQRDDAGARMRFSDYQAAPFQAPDRFPQGAATHTE